MPEIPKLNSSEYVQPVEPIDETDFDPSREDETKRFEQTVQDAEQQMPKNETQVKTGSNEESPASKAMENVTMQINEGAERQAPNSDSKTDKQLLEELKRKMLEAQLRSK